MSTFSERGVGRQIWLVPTIQTKLAPLYLGIFFAGSCLALVASYLAPGFSFRGQGWEVIVPWATFLASLVLWFLYRPLERWSPLFKWLLGALFLYWIVAVVTSRIGGDALNYTALLTPLVLLMIFLKPFSRPNAIRNLDIAAWGLIFSAIIAQFFVAVDVVNPRLDFSLRFPLLPPLGIEYRWEGPFGNVNYSGPLGAFLLVYGAGRAGWQRWPFLLAGVSMLLASEARGGILAALAGLFVLLLTQSTIGSFKFTRARRIAVAVIVLPAVGLLAYLLDPTGNGRLIIWPEFLSAWTVSPVFGLSGGEINELKDQGHFSFYSTKAHNWLIDTLVDQGLLGLSVALAILVLSVWICMRANNEVRSIVIALITTSIVSRFSEQHFNGSYLNLQYLLMVSFLALATAQQGEMMLREKQPSNLGGHRYL